MCTATPSALTVRTASRADPAAATTPPLPPHRLDAGVHSTSRSSRPELSSRISAARRRSASPAAHCRGPRCPIPERPPDRQPQQHLIPRSRQPSQTSSTTGCPPTCAIPRSVQRVPHLSMPQAASSAPRSRHSADAALAEVSRPSQRLPPLRGVQTVCVVGRRWRCDGAVRFVAARSTLDAGPTSRERQPRSEPRDHGDRVHQDRLVKVTRQRPPKANQGYSAVNGDIR